MCYIVVYKDFHLSCQLSCQWVGVCHQTLRDWHVSKTICQWPDTNIVILCEPQRLKPEICLLLCQWVGVCHQIPRDWRVGWPNGLTPTWCNINCIVNKDFHLKCLSSCQWVGVCHQNPRDWHVGWQWPDVNSLRHCIVNKSSPKLSVDGPVGRGLS